MQIASLESNTLNHFLLNVSTSIHDRINYYRICYYLEQFIQQICLFAISHTQQISKIYLHQQLQLNILQAHNQHSFILICLRQHRQCFYQASLSAIKQYLSQSVNPKIENQSADFIPHNNQYAILTMNSQARAQQQVARKFHKGFKAAIGLSLVTGFILYRIFFTQPQVACIYDAYQQATNSANRDLALQKNSSAYEGNSNMLTIAGKAFIGAGQVLMDISIALFGILWLVKVKNMRGFGAFAAFYLTRSLIFLNIEKFPFPENLVWRSPGFFSFTVPYDHTRDFFYSGHTGALTIIFLQLFQLNLGIPSILTFLSMIFMMNMLLITRVHYVADIIGGLVFAVWYHRTAVRGTEYIDKCLSLPFFIVKWLYINKCKPLCIDESEATEQEKRQNDIQPKHSSKNLKIEIDNELIEIQSRKTDKYLNK